MALCVAGETPHFERRVADYLRREARKELELAVRLRPEPQRQSALADLARYVEPLGLLRRRRVVELFLAVDSPDRLYPRLSRRA